MPKITVINTETNETKTFKAGFGANLRKAANYKDVEIYKGMAKMLNCRGMGICGTWPNTSFSWRHQINVHGEDLVRSKTINLLDLPR